jgi:hypothetical protein
MTKNMKNIILSIFVILLTITIFLFPVLVLAIIWSTSNNDILTKLLITDMVLGLCFGVTAKVIDDIF